MARSALLALLALGLHEATVAFPGARAGPPPPNTDPIAGYWDCCKPACASHDSPEHDSFDTCLVTGLSPGVYHRGASVCHSSASTLGRSCGADATTYNAECLQRAPKIHGSEVYSYVSYTEPPCPDGGCARHQFCGACRKLTLNATDSDTIGTYYVKYVNSKPHPARPGPGKMTGYRLLVPGAGMGDHASGCACTFPGIYTPDICGESGTGPDTEHCKRFGGMQTERGCEALGDPAAVTACREIKLKLLNGGSYGRSARGHHIEVLADEGVACDRFDSVMSPSLWA